MFLLRLAFLVPAFADFALAGATAFRMAGIADASLLPRAQVVAIATCWGILLLFGLREPVRRAWILGPTALVISLIAVAYVVGFASGAVPAFRATFTALFCASMVVLCLVGLKIARRS